MEKEIECLVEALIKMLGKSNKRVIDLTNRVEQLEEIVRESVLQDDKSEPIKEIHAAFTN
ncbi:hypothetical protein ACTHO0_05945 [Cytobacillus praedii]|uniref:Uncharacterized protein n=1 Tax=Cytobacillus praedii TaxID=1742358 RepID=A0A4R1B5Z4_9BACI|nr:hypothetical protein [Cytobacillus praedii]MED3549381.1 hypothetical protein [Cytobacillus praedii]TCJ06240.1 hypothetical protein E0Y62_00060 [Cytobacillus praedii]